MPRRAAARKHLSWREKRRINAQIREVADPDYEL
jgi:hypothetical protein